MTTDTFHSAPRFDSRQIMVGEVPIGGGAPLAVIAGPCVIESAEHTVRMAKSLVEMSYRTGIPIIFKASYDKANRTSIKSFRGPGLEEGLRILHHVKEATGLAILTDVHEASQAAKAAEVCDILQVPAFLCRQTDFVLAVGAAGKPVNIKKGQFLAPWDVGNIVDKLVESGNSDVLLTERGTSFGYGSLVTDMRSLTIMREKARMPVCFDATHAVQEPGALGHATGGNRAYVPVLARAACAAGVDALFVETHDQPDKAMSDGPNMVPLDKLEELLRMCKSIDAAVRAQAPHHHHA